MVILIKAVQLVLALSILILVHEFGHFFFAKIFGIRVDKFYLFFDAGGFRLFSTKSGWFVRLFPKAKNWETEYGIGWLPLGGYCKISGMIDESMDTEHLAQEPQPWEFRTKPAWQRLLVMAGGVLMNFLLAILVYTGILSHWGESYFSNQDNCIYVNSLAHEMGFRSGDKVLKFDDHEPENIDMLQVELVREKVRKATVLRDGDTLDIYIDHNMMGKVLNTPGMFSLAVPFTVDSLMTDSPNAGTDLIRDDRIITVNGQPTPFVQDSRELLKSLAGQRVQVTVIRGADTLMRELQIDSTGMFGFRLKLPTVRTREYTFLSAIPAGFRRTMSTISGYAKDLGLVLTPSTEAYKSVGSFISIGQIFPSAWNWFTFLNILALLSVMLGVMNLIPIPALDGGHILFTLYEMITGRKPSDRFLYIMQIIGMLLIFGLMFLAFGNDIARLFR